MSSKYINRICDFKNDNQNYKIKSIEGDKVIYELCSSNSDSSSESEYDSESSSGSESEDELKTKNVITQFKKVTIEEYNSDNSICSELSSDDDSDSYSSNSSDDELPS